MTEQQENNITNPLSPGILLTRVLGIFIAPRKTLMKVLAERNAFVPVLLIAASLALFRFGLMPELIANLNDPQFLQTWASQREITETEAEQEIEKIIELSPIYVFLESPLLAISGIFFISLVIQILGRIQYKILMPFIIVFRLVAWASVISVVPLLLNALFVIIDPELQVPSNLAVFLDKESVGIFMYNVFQALDIFLIWEIWLLAICFSILYKVSMQTSVNTLGTIFLVILMLNLMLSTAR